jgi:hypothetical protein
MNESIAEAADVLMSLVERIERARFDLARVTADDGVALAFYRRVDATSADEATAYAVVLDEESPSQWEALGASELQPGGSRVASVRPSERGDWIVAIYGSAPVDARCRHGVRGRRTSAARGGRLLCVHDARGDRAGTHDDEATVRVTRGHGYAYQRHQ